MPCNSAETTALKNSAQVGAIILQMAISKDEAPGRQRSVRPLLPVKPPRAMVAAGNWWHSPTDAN
jgi:hypothetical protein